MKRCSYCGHKNEDTAVRCSACQTEFAVPEPLPPEVDPRLTDPALSLVTVATFRNVVDAGLLKTRLEAAGIEACIPEEYTPHLFWNIIPSPLESVTVRVTARDYEAAMELYREHIDTAITAILPKTSAAENIAAHKDEMIVKEVADSEPQKACVACGAAIPESAALCPKCGWTQPCS